MLRAALFGDDERVAEGWAGAVSEALPGIFLHRAQDVLRVFIGPVLDNEREDPADHDAHGIITQILRDRGQL